MKKLIILILTAGIIYSCGKKDQPVTDTTSGTNSANNTASTENNTSNKNNDAPDNVDINKFTAKYKFEGNVNGDAQLIKKGEKVKQISNIKINDMQTSQDTYFDYTDGTVHMIMNMMGQKIGMKFNINDFKKYSGSTGQPTNTAEYLKNMDEYLKKGKKIGEETILGKTCEVYDMGNNFTMSVYDRKIPMKMKTEGMTITMTDFSNDANISDSSLEPPQDVQYSDGNNVGELINKLKKK